MRDLSVVMNKLEELAPELKPRFDSIRESIPYTAPEATSMLWRRAAAVLQLEVTEDHPNFTAIVKEFNGS
jgi:hypothetical protein